ncbi:uncharacterized protein BP01DRAFT_357254 [Aspergillus saccharolyticus JOP 1030-1]|uniref:ABM domain-containing protein n=1 Tax=Aspergillus saccharolyticus JOP 1030-1 TaxID=1450539 RepID=A0A318ZC40_9EURO|nr:hypothetical protein BP01DRAFT_357254 [Aspergillus saccharolyticus JOP 1030-1]PYH44899.1 hypothetical protein BP01DRAFT_357254 [Aspergillus saccharolyticus JOP 1030-1]
MPSLYLTLLHLSQPLSPTPPSTTTQTIHNFLRTTTQESHSKTTTIYTQIEEPHYIYLLHRAEEQATHDLRLPQQSTPEAPITHEWTHQIDLPASAAELPLMAPVLAIGRYFVRADQCDQFQRTFEETKGFLEEFTAPAPVAGGWRRRDGSEGAADAADSADNAAEFVLFSGWEAVEKHFAFAETKGFKEFARIKEFMEGAEIKHAVRWRENEAEDC